MLYLFVLIGLTCSPCTNFQLTISKPFSSFFSSSLTLFFICLLPPSNVVLNSSHLIFLSIIKPPHLIVINLSSLSLPLVLFLAIHPRQPLVRRHYPQEFHLTNWTYIHLSPLLICYFAWLICVFFRVKVLEFSLRFLLILPKLTII